MKAGQSIRIFLLKPNQSLFCFGLGAVVGGLTASSSLSPVMAKLSLLLSPSPEAPSCATAVSSMATLSSSSLDAGWEYHAYCRDCGFGAHSHAI